MTSLVGGLVNELTVMASPTLNASSAASLAPNGTFVFRGADAISVSDPSGTAEELTLMVTQGTLSLGTSTNLTVSSNGPGSLLLSGSLTNLNNDLTSLTYTPSSVNTGSDTLSLSDEDTSDSLTGTASVAITVNSLAPVITDPSSVSVNENGTLDFTGNNVVSVADSGGAAEQLTLTVSNGVLALGTTAGLTVTGNGTGWILLSGTLASLDSDLASLTYAPTSGFNGPDTLWLSDEDTSDSVTGSAGVSVTVNPLPALKAPTSVSVNENASLTFSGGNAISVTDTAGGGNDNETLTLSVSHGTLGLGSTTGLTLSGTGTTASPLTLSGTLSALNADLPTLVYTPTSGYSGSDMLSLSILDTSNDAGGSPATVAITVNSSTSVHLGMLLLDPSGSGALDDTGSGLITVSQRRCGRRRLQ